MKIVKALALISVLTSSLLFSISSHAAGIAMKIYIDTIKVDIDGQVVVTFLSNFSTVLPSCTVNGATVTPSTNKFTFDVSDTVVNNVPTANEGAKLMLTNLLAAKLGNKKVYAIGTNSCVEVDSTFIEKLSFVSII